MLGIYRGIAVCKDLSLVDARLITGKTHQIRCQLANAGFPLINDYKYGYYEALKASSAGWHENRNSYEPFITFLLQILYACYKEMDERFIEGSAHTKSKSRLVENTLLQCFVPVSKGEIIDRLPEISVTTIERVLGQMVKDGRIVKIGENRGARYMRNSDR